MFIYPRMTTQGNSPPNAMFTSLPLSSIRFTALVGKYLGESRQVVGNEY